MFDETIAQFDLYCESLVGRSESLNLDLAAEVKERLKQLSLIVARVRQLERQDQEKLRQLQARLGQLAAVMFAAANTESVNVSPEIDHSIIEQNEHWENTGIELRVFTEAFYYFAARIRTILRKQPFPGLKNFECPGVRDVRNHLIEHPEGRSSGVFSQSFGWGYPDGPKLKGGRPPSEGQDFQDAGLYANAEEFKLNLWRSLSSALARP